MNTMVISPVAVAVVNLVETREALIKGIGKVGALIGAYASALDSSFDLVNNQGEVTTKWFELKGALKKGIKSERASFVADMTEAGYSKSTIDVYWQRVKEASGYVTSGNRAKGSSDVDSKTMAELKTMINRIFKAEEEGNECNASDYKGALMEVFEGLGGDVDTLG